MTKSTSQPSPGSEGGSDPATWTESDQTSSNGEGQSDIEIDCKEELEAQSLGETESDGGDDEASLISTEGDNSSSSDEGGEDQEMDDFGLTKSDKANSTDSPDHIAFDQIQAAKESTDLVLNSRAFNRLLREIALDFSGDIRFEREAAEVIQTAAEDHIITLFDHANEIAVGTGGEGQEIVSNPPS